MLKLLFCLLVYHVYEGNTVSEEIISFWEQVLNEGLSFFSITEPNCVLWNHCDEQFGKHAELHRALFSALSYFWTELGCSVRVHWRARVNLKFFAERASWKIIQEVSNSWRVRRRARAEWQPHILMSIKQSEWVWGQLALLSLLWDVPAPLSFCCHLPVTEPR